MENNRNYFSLFAVPMSFDVDLPELTQRYLKLQKIVHPDKFTNASDQERLLSVQQTAELNDAYNILKKPLLRARYLLKLKNVDLNDEQSTIVDSGFLMQQMELREMIEKATIDNEDIDALEKVIDYIDDLYGAKLLSLKEMFAVHDPKFDQIAQLVNKVQFFSKLREEADYALTQKSID